MKRITRNIAIFVIVCVMVLSMVALVACKDNKSGKYTVKVVDAKGNPYTSAQVQLCKVESNGSLSTCYDGVNTDAQGVATLTIGKEINDKDVDEVEVHLLGLPAYLTYDKVKMHKNETVTVTVKQAALSNPARGTGAGGYKDVFGDLVFDLDIFDPYVVYEGAYALKFTSADQAIYYEFRAEDAGVYKVYSVGDVDASVTQLLGNANSSIYNPNDDDYSNDNVSATDKNFSYQFEVSPDLVKNDNGACYFEVTLEDANDVNVDAIIIFEYISAYQGGGSDEVIDVKPAKTLDKYADVANANYVAVCNMFSCETVVKGADGYYHLDDENGAKIVATLGKGNVKPQGFDMSFVDIYTQGQTYTFTVDGVLKNYYPLVEAYTEASNSEGRYYLTDELIEFFDLYIEIIYGADRLHDQYWGLPEGQEWLVWCGYYHVATGTMDDPINLKEGNVEVVVSAGGEVYYTFEADSYYILTISSDSTNVALVVGEDNAQSDSDGFEYTAKLAEYSYYTFVFSTKNGEAATYTIKVQLEPVPAPDGSEEYPFEIDGRGWIYGETTELLEDGTTVKSVYYTYKVTAEDEVLYFYSNAGTVIKSISYGDEVKVPADWANGLTVPAGTVLKFEVSTSEIGELSFQIHNAPLGSKGNPYLILEADDFEVSVPATGVVVYKFSIMMQALDYRFSSISSNIKMTWYVDGGEKHEVAVGTDGWTFTLSTQEWTDYYIEFTAVSGGAATYTIKLEALYPLGSDENPIEIEDVNHATYNNEIINGTPVYYFYSVEEAITLYFELGDKTYLSMTYLDANDEMHYLEESDWANGLQLEAGCVLTIIVNTADWTDGPTSFTISDTPIE